MDSSKLKVVLSGDSMWPNYSDGDVIEFTSIGEDELEIGDLVVCFHPLKDDVVLIKRITSINDEQYFVEGDNPDPTASEDSHNFGLIKRSAIIGYHR